MFSTKSLAAAAAAFSLFGSSVATYDPSSEANLAVYWGQGPDQLSLAHYCQQTSIDIIPIGFINKFPQQTGNTNPAVPAENFGNACWGAPLYDGTELYQSCPNVTEGIPVCQKLGKKVLLSLGGDAKSYQLTGAQAGIDFADYLWSAYGPVNAEYVAAGGIRPFDGGRFNADGTTIDIDGFDFDIELAPTDNAEGYVALINRLREHFTENPSKKYIISGAPQCPLPEKNMGDLITKAAFDILFIQFYNNPSCSARSWANANTVYGVTGEANTAGFNFDSDSTSSENWVDFLSTGASSGAQIYVGLSASTSAASTVDYLLPQEAKNLISAFHSKDKFGGVMLWEATAAEGNTFNRETYYDLIKSYLLEADPPVSSTTSSSSTSTTSTSSSSSATTTTSAATTTSEAPTATPTTVESVGECEYIGCYAEPLGARALSGATFIDYDLMTVELCAEKCSGYTLFGVEYKGECYCGGEFTAGTDGIAPQQVSASQCELTCGGNAGEFCGGSAVLDIYQCGPLSSSTSSSSIATSTSAASSSTTSEAATTSTSSDLSSSTTSEAASSTTSEVSSSSTTSELSSSSTSEASSTSELSSSSTSEAASSTTDSASSSTSEVASSTTSEASSSSTIESTSSSTSEAASSTTSEVSYPSTTESATSTTSEATSSSTSESASSTSEAASSSTSESSPSSTEAASSSTSETASSTTSEESYPSTSAAASSSTAEAASSSVYYNSTGSATISTSASTIASTSISTSTFVTLPPYSNSTSITSESSPSSTSDSSYPTSSVESETTSDSYPSSSTEISSAYPTSTPLTSAPVTSEDSSPTTTGDVSYTTSTVRETQTYTITSCAATVTNCPVGSVTTKTVDLYTTICPVSETESSSGAITTPAPLTTPAPVPESTTEFTTSTVKTTQVITITSCAPEVTNCPIGSVTTKTIDLYTTVCPVTETQVQATVTPAPTEYTTSTVYATSVYTITACAPSVTDCPGKIGQVTTEIVVDYTTVCPVTAETPAPTTAPEAKPTTVPGGAFIESSSTEAVTYSTDHETTTLSSTLTSYVTIKIQKSTLAVAPTPSAPYPTGGASSIVKPSGTGVYTISSIELPSISFVTIKPTAVAEVTNVKSEDSPESTVSLPAASSPITFTGAGNRGSGVSVAVLAIAAVGMMMMI